MFVPFIFSLNRCRTWIEKTQRFDLLGKSNVHDERICQQHFEPVMFLNDSQNRLQQYAIPTLYLSNKPPPMLMPTLNSLLAVNGFTGGEHAFNVSQFWYLFSEDIWTFSTRFRERIFSIPESTFHSFPNRMQHSTWECWMQQQHFCTRIIWR